MWWLVQRPFSSPHTCCVCCHKQHTAGWMLSHRSFSQYSFAVSIVVAVSSVWISRDNEVYNHGQKSLGHCTFKQGNAITLERQTLGRRFYAQPPNPPPPPLHLPQPMLKTTGSILASRTQHCLGGEGGKGRTVRCFVPLMHLGINRKIPKCPKTFGHECSYALRRGLEKKCWL